MGKPATPTSMHPCIRKGAIPGFLPNHTRTLAKHSRFPISTQSATHACAQAQCGGACMHAPQHQVSCESHISQQPPAQAWEHSPEPNTCCRLSHAWGATAVKQVHAAGLAAHRQAVRRARQVRAAERRAAQARAPQHGLQPAHVLRTTSMSANAAVAPQYVCTFTITSLPASIQPLCVCSLGTPCRKCTLRIASCTIHLLPERMLHVALPTLDLAAPLSAAHIPSPWLSV